MSSMDRTRLPLIALFAIPAITLATPACGQTPMDTAQARQQLVATSPTRMAQVLDRWEMLVANDRLDFDAYAGFVLANPGFPKETLLQARAEKALGDEPVSSERMVAFFDSHPPLTNAARARYALALANLGRPEALQVAREAWRGGSMSGPSTAYLEGLFGSQFSQADQDARMDALLWQGDEEAARRQIALVTPGKQDLFMARFAFLRDQSPSSAGLSVPALAASDPGYVYNQVRYLRKARQTGAAVSVLANRPAFDRLPVDAADFVTEMLTVAKNAGPSQAVAIAAKADDLFAPGADISEGSFRLRDKYTDLMWLGGTSALWSLGDGRSAAPLFYRYGMAAKTPLTRSKGLYWAGRAAQRAGDTASAETYYSEAANYADQYYGQLALEALGRPIPPFAAVPAIPPTAAQRAEFNANRLVQALETIAANRRDWKTERAFFETLSEQADNAGTMSLVAQLARDLGLNEFAVVAGATAPENGLTGFERVGHPTVEVPYGVNWTMSHAIMRQESEFDRTRVSHAGARGMMQLMPGTAREQAGKLGMNYMSASLIGDTQYNIRLGDAYFKRMLDYYGGSYPLAIGAYNAGPGRVNQWLRLNGDPRTGAIDYVTWIEKIPANFETRYYIMRVLGNAVAYDNMYPEKAPGGQPRTISYFLR